MQDEKKTKVQLIRELQGLRRQVDTLGIIEQKNKELTSTLQGIQLDLQKVYQSLEGVVRAMVTAVEKRDPHMEGHQRRVALVSVAIGREMGLSEEQLDCVHLAGVIHDLGKITIPTEILGTPGKLDKNQFSIIKTHPQKGYEILKEIDFPWPVAKIMLQHHERENGSGYPSGIKGKDILPEAKIIAVADVVEAMTSPRPYRPALGMEKALEEVAGKKGRLFDPEVVDACVRIFKEKGFSFN
jgi:putative nucleotidyltransferase with HDIG domain